MKRLLRIALSFVVLGTPCRAGLVFEKKEIATQPSAVAAEVQVRYPFRNSGPGTVRIKSIRSDCSCAIPSLARDSYAPGESGEVVVKFEIGSRHGPQKKSVIVTTDDPTQPLETLSLTASIPQVLTLSTNALLWTEGEAPTAKTITVKTPEDLAVTDLRAAAKSQALRMDVERVSQTEFRVHVTPAPKTTDLSTSLHFDAVLKDGPVKRSVVFVRVR